MQDLMVTDHRERTGMSCKLIPNLGSKGIYLDKLMKEKLIEHKEYIREYGVDMPCIIDWKWPNKK